MLRRQKHQIGVASLILSSFLAGFIVIQSFSFSDQPQKRDPAASTDWKQSDFDRATPAVAFSDNQNSQPAVGRSYFDMIFSKKDATGLKYDIPYPFNRIIAKLEDYNGQKVNLSDSSGPKVTIFPMGRSLQRDAAVVGLNQPFSFDPYFRYPRIVVGIDEEPKYENSLVLNLKNKFYIGFNERAEVLEVISYNDLSGRFEYQVVHDYANGKQFKVSYANRSNCIQCHQNQTPIFSVGEWKESNANVAMSDGLKKKMDSVFGAVTCGVNNDQAYCYKNGTEPQYFGATLKIDTSITRSFDASTDKANLIHMYQKGWKELCTDMACRQSFLEAILLYRFSSPEGLIPDAGIKNMLAQIDQNWKTKYPNGLSIASPNIPNRDPLKDIVMTPAINASSLSTVKATDVQSVQQFLNQSKIPAAFEPLLPRLPLDIFKDSGFTAKQTNRLIEGLAEEFTLTDIRMFDRWLSATKAPNQVMAELTSQCQVDQVGADTAFTCAGKGTDQFSFDAYISNGAGQVSDLSIQSPSLGCDPAASNIEQNKFSGKSCPQFENINMTFTKNTATTATILFRRLDGLSLRTLHGYYVAEATLDLTTKQAKLKIYNQSAAIKNVISQAQNELFNKTQTFSRFQIMTALMNFAQMQGVRMQNSDMTGLEMKVDGQMTLQQLSSAMTGFDVMKNTCIKCHENNEGFPPNFMGTPIVKLGDYDLCRRIEQCAPRLIYRIKMRNCGVNTDNKKTPMPPDYFLQGLDPKMPPDMWMKAYSPKVLTYLMSLVSEADVAKTLTAHGLNANDAMIAAQDILRNACPNSNSVIYDQLPRCEFNQLNNLTRCH